MRNQFLETIKLYHKNEKIPKFHMAFEVLGIIAVNNQSSSSIISFGEKKHENSAINTNGVVPSVGKMVGKARRECLMESGMVLGSLRSWRIIIFGHGSGSLPQTDLGCNLGAYFLLFILLGCRGLLLLLLHFAAPTLFWLAMSCLSCYCYNF